MEYLDDMFSQFSEAFLGNMVGEGDIAYRPIIHSATFDYSIKSLDSVDDYLRYVYENPINKSTIEYQNTIVWCGAYIGEVIRRNASVEYHWVHYNDYIKHRDQGMKNILPYTLTTHALLVSSDLFMTMPLNKVARWLDEGESNNIPYFADLAISRKSPSEPAIPEVSQIKAKPWWKFW